MGASVNPGCPNSKVTIYCDKSSCQRSHVGKPHEHCICAYALRVPRCFGLNFCPLASCSNACSTNSTNCESETHLWSNTRRRRCSRMGWRSSMMQGMQNNAATPYICRSRLTDLWRPQSHRRRADQGIQGLRKSRLYHIRASSPALLMNRTCSNIRAFRDRWTENKQGDRRTPFRFFVSI